MNLSTATLLLDGFLPRQVGVEMTKKASLEMTKKRESLSFRAEQSEARNPINA